MHVLKTLAIVVAVVVACAAARVCRAQDRAKILYDPFGASKELGVDLTKLDFVVISHRHADHATGLRYVLSVNPKVTVYVPSDGSNGFGGAPFPKAFLRP